MYYTRGNLDAALADLSKAIELGIDDYDRSGFYLRRGIVYNSKKDFDKAIADFNWIIERVPQLDVPNLDTSAYVNRGLAFEGKQQASRAIEDYTTAIQLKDSANAHLRRGMLYLKLGDDAPTIADLSRALQLDQDNPQALLTRSQAYVNVRDYDHALSDVIRRPYDERSCVLLRSR